MESIGTHLRRERELRQLTLEELSLRTRIPCRTLSNIELDRFEELPGEVFAKGFLRSYASAIGIDADDVLAQYGHGRRTPLTDAMVIPSFDAPEKGKRFGVALAVVVLLILFSLALSIVLRPRQQDSQIELSARDTTPATLALTVSASETHQGC